MSHLHKEELQELLEPYEGRGSLTRLPGYVTSSGRATVGAQSQVCLTHLNPIIVLGLLPPSYSSLAPQGIVGKSGKGG